MSIFSAKSRRQPRVEWLLLGACCALALLASCSSAQEKTVRAQDAKKDYAQEISESFKNLPAKNPRWGWIWPDVARLVNYEAEGVRFDLPPAPAKGRNPVGLGAKLTIKGDFEITVRYEVLGETASMLGDAAAYFGLEVVLSGPRRLSASLKRISGGDERTHLLAMADSFDTNGKRKVHIQPHPIKSKAGRLRLVRTSDELAFFAADANAEEFSLMLKHGFGAEDVSSVALTAGTQDMQATLNVRLADLRIRADAIPQKPIAMADINKGPPQKKKQPPPPVKLADLPPPSVKVKFHQDFRGGDPMNPNLRFVRNQNIKWEAGGAHVTMPADQGKMPTTGIAANFQVKGDFDITASYEILQAAQPTEGYGVGVSLYVAIDPDAGDALSLARRVGIKGGVNFVSDRMTPNPAKGGMNHFTRTRPSKEALGKLRIQRVGPMVRFLCADGGDDFTLIVQDFKSNKVETEFGPADIRYFQIGADAGNSQAALDVRLLDLTIEAAELPGLVEAKKHVPAWIANPKNAERPGTSRAWLIALGVGGAATLAGGAVLGLLLVRRRARPDSAVAAAAATVSFTCKECGKKLRAKEKLIGKSIKCPRCQAAVPVPAASG